MPPAIPSPGAQPRRGGMMNQFKLSGTVTSVEPYNYKEDKYLYRIVVDDGEGNDVPLTLFTEVKQGQQVNIEGRLGGWENKEGKLFLQTAYTELKRAQNEPAPAETTSAF